VHLPLRFVLTSLLWDREGTSSRRQAHKAFNLELTPRQASPSTHLPKDGLQAKDSLKAHPATPWEVGVFSAG
jgi:hypothetical protein